VLLLGGEMLIELGQERFLVGTHGTTTALETSVVVMVSGGSRLQIRGALDKP
jgi:hypothetical protein